MKISTHLTFSILLVVLFSAVPFQTTSAQTPAPVVQIVLFYSSTCGACHVVITEVLPPIYEQYGQQLEIFMVEISSAEGRDLFLSSVTMMGSERAAVPFLVIGDRYLIGTVDIPEQLPGLIESHLAEGGLGWPDLPGLSAYMAVASITQAANVIPTQAVTSAQVPGTVEPSPSVSTPVFPVTPTMVPAEQFQPDDFESSILENISRDPMGNSLSILLLLGMLFSLGWTAWYLLMKPGLRLTGFASWSILLLCFLGLVIAGYLSYVELQQVEAWCGLIGDCNTVQHSQYARLFGFLPVSVLGILGYLLVLASWNVCQDNKGKWGDYAAVAQLLLTTLATLFSIYLTFLEPFVIGATCLWCLSSAVISTLLMLFSVPPGKLALTNIFRK